MYVLDTNVISELRKGKKAQRSVRMWAQALPTASLYLSVVSVLELEIGTLLVERRDRRQGAILRAWIDGHVLPSFSGRFARHLREGSRSASTRKMHCSWQRKRPAALRHCWDREGIIPKWRWTRLRHRRDARSPV